MTRCSRYVFEVVGRGCEFATAPVCVGWSPKRELYVLSVSPYLFYDTKTDFYDPSEWRFWNESKNNVYNIFRTRCFDVPRRRGEKTNIKSQTVFSFPRRQPSYVCVYVFVCVWLNVVYFFGAKKELYNIIFETLYSHLFVLITTTNNITVVTRFVYKILYIVGTLYII